VSCAWPGALGLGAPPARPPALTPPGPAGKECCPQSGPSSLRSWRGINVADAGRRHGFRDESAWSRSCRSRSRRRLASCQAGRRCSGPPAGGPRAPGRSRGGRGRPRGGTPPVPRRRSRSRRRRSMGALLRVAGGSVPPTIRPSVKRGKSPSPPGSRASATAARNASRSVSPHPRTRTPPSGSAGPWSRTARRPRRSGTWPPPGRAAPRTGPTGRSRPAAPPAMGSPRP
jgi:hypothetical protein